MIAQHYIRRQQLENLFHKKSEAPVAPERKKIPRRPCGHETWFPTLEKCPYCGSTAKVVKGVIAKPLIQNGHY